MRQAVERGGKETGWLLRFVWQNGRLKRPPLDTQQGAGELAPLERKKRYNALFCLSHLQGSYIRQRGYYEATSTSRVW